MSAIFQSIGKGHGAPPPGFVSELVSLFAGIPDSVFAPNGLRDIYSILRPVLGPSGTTPWTDISERRAAMAEVLRVDGGFESDWNWNEGADSTAGQEMPGETESGLWQPSWNSVIFDNSLRIYAARCGVVSAADFIASKGNHAFQVGYVCRLFRFNTRWSGPSNRGWIADAVNRNAMAEFQALLTPAGGASSSFSSSASTA